MGENLKISARNQIGGRVLSIEKGDIVAKVEVQIEPGIIKSVITKDAIDSLGINVDDNVVVIIKATEVMIGKK